MSIWWLVPAFVGIVGLLSLIGGLGNMLRLKVVSGTFRFLFGGLVLAGAGVLGLVGLNLQTYARLSHEQIAAEIALSANPDGSYTAQVTRANSQGVLGSPKEYGPITGDQFRMEADVVVFKPWANVLGMDALYRLDRLQGRFDSEAMENATPPKAYCLRATCPEEGETEVHLVKLPLGAANPFQLPDARFMSGAAVPMGDGAVYTLTMSRTGLVLRPKNEAAERAEKLRQTGANSGEIYQAPIDLRPAPSQGEPTP